MRALLLASMLVAGSCAPAEESVPPTDAGHDATDGGVDAEEGGDTDADNPFAHCPTFVPSTCSLAATCAELDCGAPLSLLDAEGCLRERCKADSECGQGERCVSTALLKGGWCVPPNLIQCAGDASACNCTSTVDCLGNVYCVSVEAAPPADDCDLSGAACFGPLEDRQDALERQIADFALSSELVQKLQACVDKIKQERATRGC